jgi:hypothetical protein
MLQTGLHDSQHGNTITSSHAPSRPVPVADTWLQESHSHKQHVLQPLAAGVLLLLLIIIITSRQSHPPSQLRAFVTALPALLAATGRSSCAAPQQPCLTLPQVVGHYTSPAHHHISFSDSFITKRESEKPSNIPDVAGRFA